MTLFFFKQEKKIKKSKKKIFLGKKHLGHLPIVPYLVSAPDQSICNSAMHDMTAMHDIYENHWVLYWVYVLSVRHNVFGLTLQSIQEELCILKSFFITTLIAH